MYTANGNLRCVGRRILGYLLIMTIKYTFKPYSNIFPTLFLVENERICRALKKLKVEVLIEHVGSTAIPNLGGKGIIDIAIEADDEVLTQISTELKKLGYTFHEQWSTPERLFFKAHLPDSEEDIRSYHIHLISKGSPEWNNLIAFRDYLIENKEIAANYAELKKLAAEEARSDGEKYRKLKEPMITEILKIISRT